MLALAADTAIEQYERFPSFDYTRHFFKEVQEGFRLFVSNTGQDDATMDQLTDAYISVASKGTFQSVAAMQAMTGEHKNSFPQGQGRGFERNCIGI